MIYPTQKTRIIKIILPLIFLRVLGFTQILTDSTAKVNVSAQQQTKENFRLRNDWAYLKYYENANAKLDTPKPDEKRVVFIGNSIIKKWGDLNPAFFKDKPYINRGISGQTTPQILLRFRQDVINLKPKVVVILAGTNDIAGNTGPTSIETIVGNIISMAQLAQIAGIKVVISSILPVYDYPWKTGTDPVSKIAIVNDKLKDFTQNNHMVYLDFYTTMADKRKGIKLQLTKDGVHPNIMGYLLMDPLVEAAIKAALTD